MAMYKDSDINAALIKEKLPAVHAEIMGEASAGSDELTAESLKKSHPDVAASIMEEGKASAGADMDAAVSAERERIASINALARPGAEAIIEEALADSTMTADAVKLKLFDADESKRTKTLETHRESGKKLADNLADLSNAEEGEDKPGDKKAAVHDSIMTRLTGGKN